MNKLFYLVFFLMIFKGKTTNAQIKQVKQVGYTINVYGNSGDRTGGYNLQNDNEAYLGHNATFFLIKRMNSILVFDRKGREYSKRGISIANNRSFLKITEKSIWIKEGQMIRYYNFSGDILINYREE
jgi:hypothetical protein